MVGVGFAFSPVYHQLQQHHVGVLGEFGVVLSITVPLQQRCQVQVAGHFIGELPGGETHGPGPGGDVGNSCLQVPQVGPQALHAAGVAQEVRHAAEVAGSGLRATACDRATRPGTEAGTSRWKGTQHSGPRGWGTPGVPGGPEEGPGDRDEEASGLAGACAGTRRHGPACPRRSLLLWQRHRPRPLRDHAPRVPQWYAPPLGIPPPPYGVLMALPKAHALCPLRPPVEVARGLRVRSPAGPLPATGSSPYRHFRRACASRRLRPPPFCPRWCVGFLRFFLVSARVAVPAGKFSPPPRGSTMPAGPVQAMPPAQPAPPAESKPVRAERAGGGARAGRAELRGVVLVSGFLRCPACRGAFLGGAAVPSSRLLLIPVGIARRSPFIRRQPAEEGRTDDWGVLYLGLRLSPSLEAARGCNSDGREGLP